MVVTFEIIFKGLNVLKLFSFYCYKNSETISLAAELTVLSLLMGQGQMLSPLAGAGSGVVSWMLKQTGVPVRVDVMGIVNGLSEENERGAGVMICRERGDVTSWGTP